MIDGWLVSMSYARHLKRVPRHVLKPCIDRVTFGSRCSLVYMRSGPRKQCHALCLRVFLLVNRPTSLPSLELAVYSI